MISGFKLEIMEITHIKIMFNLASKSHPELVTPDQMGREKYDPISISKTNF